MLQATIVLILAAIAAVAMAIPGLNALDSSLDSLIASKKKEVEESCYVDVAKFKIEFEECTSVKNAKVDENFGEAKRLITQARTAFGQIEESTESNATTNSNTSTNTSGN